MKEWIDYTCKSVEDLAIDTNELNVVLKALSKNCRVNIISQEYLTEHLLQ